jgi:hypothetical protein
MLSPVGFTVLVLALIILVRSLSSRNAYEIVLSAALLCVWLALFFTGLWACKRLASLEPGWKPPSPLGANTSGGALITGLDRSLPWFFRLHFLVRGRFFPAGDSAGCAVFAETSAPRTADHALLNLSFPMSGVFRGEGFCRLKDILGFFSFPCGPVQRRSFPVQSRPCLAKPFRIDAYSGAEDRRNKTATDEERYYMREYAPGDRLRDINWKSSDRIDTLITRISPDNQEKVTRIEVYFRNYRAGGRASLEDLWLLDRSKARLAHFLRAVKEEQASYIFQVRAAQGSWDIKDTDELEQFLEELAAIPFAPSRHNDASGDLAGAIAGELYVFSTACDGGLPAFLLSRQTVPTYVFLARPPVLGAALEGVERLHARDFVLDGLVPDPRWLLFPKNRHAGTLNARPGPGGLLVDYAEAGWGKNQSGSFLSCGSFST